MRLNKTLLSTSSLDGDTVKNTQGEDLGDIKDIVIDIENGQVQYYILFFGAFLGMGDKLFAIPPQAITLNTEDEWFVLKVSKDKLVNAPGFDKDNWPNMADKSYRNEIYGHYGYEYHRNEE